MFRARKLTKKRWLLTNNTTEYSDKSLHICLPASILETVFLLQENLTPELPSTITDQKFSPMC